MLKIPKGLKKKKKGKKSKRKGEEELFTEEELEQYRREHQSQPQQEQQQHQHQHQQHQHQESAVSDNEHEHEAKPSSENDEWSKFNALTTGVDSILKKTQGDLDRIKSTSFFQRVAAGPRAVDQTGKELPPKPPRPQKPDKPVAEFQITDFQRTKEEPKAEETVANVDAPLSESEDDDEEEFDDIFDTSYVEAVEKGEVKLAYIPDSPEDEVDTGPDPFDTSYADKVIKGPEVSKKGKKLVNIGAAVEVLTGRIDHVATSKEAVKKAKRRIPKDLLLENPDADDFLDLPAEDATAAKSLLDDDTEDIPKDIPVDLSVSLHTQFIQPKSADEADDSEDIPKQDILNEFDTIKQNYEDDDDEFAQLATESLSKPTIVAEEPIDAFAAVEPVLEDDSWAAFEGEKKKPSRPPPPRPASGPGENLGSAFDEPAPSSPGLDDFECDGPDPFDTTFAENILPGKAELKQIENEILNNNALSHSDSDFDFDPRADELPSINNRRKSSVHIHITDPTGVRESISGFGNGSVGDIEFDTLKPIHRDLLGGSSTDLSQLADAPIAPIAPSSLDDADNFEFSDPFDTSVVDLITAPGKTELKFIEKELLGESELKRSLSDPDFDPRAEEPAPSVNQTRKPSRPENLIVNKSVLFKIPTDGESGEKNGKKTKPLTPYYSREASVTDEDVNTQDDPFEASFPVVEVTPDTTKPIVSILKNVQNEPLKRSSSDQDLNADEEDEVKGKFSQLRRHSDFPLSFKAESVSASKKTDFLSITEEESVDAKVLTPYQEEKSNGEFDVDPFDTSCVNDILLPGKTELKFLENELLRQPPAVDPLDDPDFDPRAGDRLGNVVSEVLLAPSDDVFQVKPLTPEITSVPTGFLIDTEENEIDPFDTSIADNLGPGKTELKLLESEFVN